MTTKACELQAAFGRFESCPQDRCPFWDRDACVFDDVRSHVVENPALAGTLLDLRAALERARAADEAAGARLVFFRLLNEEQAAE